MANLRILSITGDEDYSALAYEKAEEDGKIVPLELWEDSFEKQEELDYNGEFYYKAYKFGDVDPKFLDFVEGLKDYYDSKHNNFYLV